MSSYVGGSDAESECIYNLLGDFRLFKGGHDYKFTSITFGKLKGQDHQPANEFIRRGAGQQQMAPEEGFKVKRCAPNCHPPVPKREIKTANAAVGRSRDSLNGQQITEQQIQKKNHILSNAIDIALLRVPVKEKPRVYVEKANYGKVPAYLAGVKKDIEQEYRVFQRNMRIQRGQPADPEQDKGLSKADLTKLRNQLKAKWDELHGKYAKIAHRTLVDTLVMKESKLQLEAQMTTLETEIRKLRLLIQDAKH